MRSGDTLGSIARRYFTTVKLIRELNQLKSDKLKLGQSVLIPSTKNTTVAAAKKPVATTTDQPATAQSYKVLHIVQASDTYQSLEKNIMFQQLIFGFGTILKGNNH
nr:LysM peptidoglycan-binding domain-containing protein [Legionella tunisiensis]